MKNKICSVDEINRLMESERANRKTVACTSGCFDILHAGHITYLEDAKEIGDVLIVLLNSDISVKMLKGDTRPIVPESERAIVLAGLQSVDYVCVFDDATPCNVLKKIRPDYFIKGGDYNGVHIPEMDILEEYGGAVKYVSVVDGCSSTNIIEKIKKQG